MKKIIFLLLCVMTMSGVRADDIYKDVRARWLETAEASKPELHYETVRPVALVKAVADAAAYQGWRYEKTGEP